MKNTGEHLREAVQRRTIQHYVGIIKSIDWSTDSAVVELKEKPGLTVHGRLGTIGGGGGDLYPPYKTGDLVWVELAGFDLDLSLEDRDPRRPRNGILMDLSDVLVTFSPKAKKGEPSVRTDTKPSEEGEWLLVGEGGFEVRFTPSTNQFVVKAPTGGKVYIGGKQNAKRALVDGDSNGAGSVDATQDTVWIGEP